MKETAEALLTDTKRKRGPLRGRAGDNQAAGKVEEGVEETLTYCDFPFEHWTRLRTINVI